MKKLIFALIAAATAMGTAQAAAPVPYVGVGIASADHNFKLSGATKTDSDGFKASGKIFGGFEIDQTFGVEAGYTHFRHAEHSFNTGNVAGRATSRGESYYVAGKATAPINEQVSVFGKLGAAYNKRELSSTVAAYNLDDSKTQVYAAVGVQFKLNQKVALIAEYERYGKSKDFGVKPDVITVGAKYSF